MPCQITACSSSPSSSLPRVSPSVTAWELIVLYGRRPTPLAVANAAPLLRCLTERLTNRGYRWGRMQCTVALTEENTLVVGLADSKDLQPVRWWLTRCLTYDELCASLQRRCSPNSTSHGLLERFFLDRYVDDDSLSPVNAEAAVPSKEEGGGTRVRPDALYLRARYHRQLRFALEGEDNISGLTAVSTLPRLTGLCASKLRLPHVVMAQAAESGAGRGDDTETTTIWPNFQSLVKLDLFNAFGVSGISVGPPASSVGGALVNYLHGLHMLPHLTEIDLSYSTLCEVGVLGRCRSLRKLDLTWTSVTTRGLLGLGESTSLEILILNHCAGVTSVQCLTPRFSAASGSSTSLNLSGAMALRTLDLRGTNIDTEGITGLELLPALSTLRLGRTNVTSLSSLRSAPAMRLLDLDHCAALFSDALEGLTHIPLEEIRFSRSGVRSIAALDRCSTLRCIKGSYASRLPQGLVQVLGPQPVYLSQLTYLDLSSTSVVCTSYPCLRQLSRIVHLNLSRTALTSLDGLLEVTELQELYIAHTQVRTLGPLTGVAVALRVIDATGSALQDEGILGLERLPHLTKLNLSSTAITTVGHLGACPTLCILDLSRSFVTSEGLRGLETATQLKELSLCETLIRYFTTWDVLESHPDLGPVMRVTGAPPISVPSSGEVSTKSYWPLVWERVSEVAGQYMRGATGADLCSGPVLTTATSDTPCRWAPYPSLCTLSLAKSSHRTSGLLGLLQMPSLTELDVASTCVDRPIGILFALSAAAAACGKAAGIPLHRRLNILSALSVNMTKSHSLCGLGYAAQMQRLDLSCCEPSLHAVLSYPCTPCHGALPATPFLCGETLIQLNLSQTDVNEDDMTSMLRGVRGVRIVPPCNSTLFFPPWRCPHLRMLNICSTSVASIAYLAGHPTLQVLQASHTAITDLSPLQTCRALVGVDVTKTSISDLRPLAHCCRLRKLVAARTPTTQEGISCSWNTTLIEHVDLSYTSVRSVEPFRSAPYLTELRVLSTLVPPEASTQLSSFVCVYR